MAESNQQQIAVFGGGCFWCVEAVLNQLRGVNKVISGYAGGTVDNPTYEQVSSGTTGHAEVAQIEFDPQLITFSDLLNVFFVSHDPTTLNKQGNDVGTQYRSVIFYLSEEQRQEAEQYIASLESQHLFNQPIVTQVLPLDKFYPAENYHQNFYNNNRDYPYCQVVIDPKITKLRQKFAHLLKNQ